MTTLSAEPPRNSFRPSMAAGLRLAVSFAAASCVSAGLFWFLSTLIATREQKDVVAAIPRIDFSRLKRDSELQEIKRVKPEIKRPDPPPSTPTLSTTKAAGVAAGLDMSALAPPGIDFAGWGGTGAGGGFGGGAQLGFGAGRDRDAVPQVRIDPNYPPAARDRHIEGWVTLKFDVGKDGSTQNVRVVAAQPRTVFDRESVRAVSGWKYSPKIENGKPVERQGLQVRLVFKLD